MGCVQSTRSRRDSLAESNELHGRGADGWEAGARSSAAFLKVQARPPIARSTGSTGSGPLRPSYATACASNTLPAFVLCDFDADPGSSELSVRRGQFVDVFVGELPSPPEGWCTCQIRGKASPAEDARGLVPWTHVVSAVHAELDAIAEEQPEDRADSQRRSSLTETEASVGMWARSRSVPVRRTERGFGIDVSERNVLVRIVPDSAAGDDGLLSVGDVILSVDGEPLAGRWLPHLLKTLPKRDVHTFVVIAQADLAPAAAAEISTPSRSFFRKSNKGSGRGPTSASPMTGRSGQEYDILSTMDLRNIYALKSWAIDDLKRPACEYQYFSFEGRDVPIGLEGLPSATAAADAATRGGTVCAPSEVISAASRLKSPSAGAGGRAAPSSPRGADPDLAAAKLFGSLDPLTKGPVPVHALWLVDVNDDLVSGAMAVALDRAVSEQGRSAAQIVARLNALRRSVPFELVCMSMRSRGGRSPSGGSRRPKYPPSLERLGCEVEVAVGGGTTDHTSSSRFFGYTRKEAALVLATMRSHGVTHVWVGGLAPEGAVLVSALHAAEAGLCTVVLSDCSRACSLACGSADTSLLAKASINLVESTDVKPLRVLASAKDTAAAASKAAAVGVIVASIGADTGRAPLVEEMLDPASAVYRISGDTVPAWVFAQLQQKVTRQRYQQEQIDILAKEQQQEEQLRAQQKQQRERDEREQHEQAALAATAAAPLKLQREAQPGSAAAASGAPTATRDAGPPGHARSLSSGGRKLAEKSRPFWETKDTRKHREPPKPAVQVGTMRMDEMLEEARRGALADGTAEATAHFELLLERYRKHPSVQRREREAAEAAEEAEALASAVGTALAESSTAQEASDARAALAMAAEVSAGAVAFSAAVEERRLSQRLVEERRLSQRLASPVAMQSPQLAPVAMQSPASRRSSTTASPPEAGAALLPASLISPGETGWAQGSSRGNPPAGPSRHGSLDEPPHGARDSRGERDSKTARWILGRNSRGSRGSRGSAGSHRSSRGSQGDCSSSEEEAPAPSPSGRMPIVRINTPKLNLGKVREAEEERAGASHQKAHAVLLATLAEGESSVGSTLINPSQPGSSRRGSSRPASRPASACGGSSGAEGADGAEGAEGGAATLRMVELEMAAVPEASQEEVLRDGGTLQPSRRNSISFDPATFDPIPKPPHITFSLDLAGRDDDPSPSPLKQLRRTLSADGARFAALVAADTEEVSICSLSTSGRDSAAARTSTASRASRASLSSDSHGSFGALPVGIPLPISTGTTPTRAAGTESRTEEDRLTSPEKSPSRSARKGKGYARKTVLTKHLGAGSCGSVYIGLCNGEEVAVKVLPLEDDTAEAVKREIRILRECDCEHIVAYKDAFMREYQMRPTLWVVMEFCHGGSLLDVMRKMGSAFPEPCIATICVGVLKALNYMHVQRKAIHRDIKSANVLLTADGWVKLADLGVVAQLFNTMSKRGTMIGTPHWMAPETLGLSGGAAGYDTKVDIWSLGVTAIECAEQKPPFSNTTSIYETMMHIVQGPPATLAPETNASDDFAAFIAAALVKNPTERLSASDLLEHPFLKKGSQEELKGIVQYVLGGNPLDNITTI